MNIKLNGQRNIVNNMSLSSTHLRHSPNQSKFHYQAIKDDMKKPESFFNHVEPLNERSYLIKPTPTSRHSNIQREGHVSYMHFTKSESKSRPK